MSPPPWKIETTRVLPIGSNQAYTALKVEGPGVSIAMKAGDAFTMFCDILESMARTSKTRFKIRMYPPRGSKGWATLEASQELKEKSE